MKPADRFPGLIADRWDPLPPSLRFPGLIADRWDDADPPVHTTAQFANPNHDELGRFARKGEGRAVPTKGVDGDGFANVAGHEVKVVKGATIDELWANLIGEPESDDDVDKASDPRFASNKGFGYHLIPGETVTRTRPSATGPVLYEVGAVKGVPVDQLPGPYLGMNGSGGLLYEIPGTERPVAKVFRVMDVAEWRQAKQRGFFQSDGRMNLGDEGTVVSTRSTGTFYAPPVGRSAVIVRMRVDPADGWTMDMNPDGRTSVDDYVKTHAPIPFDRVEAVTVPFEVYEEEFGDYGNTMRKYRVLDDDPLVASAGEFANPYHDDLGRFARKGEGRRVPMKGIPDKTSVATRAATKIGSAVDRLHAWKPGYPFDTDGIPGPLKSGALDWIHYRRLLPIRAAAASITGIESTDPSPAQPTQPSQRQRDQAAALLEAIAASPPKTVQRGLRLSASDADAMLEAGGIADAMATSTTVDWIAENFALGLYGTSRAGGPTVGVLVTYRNTRALPITPIYVGEGKRGVSHLLASADEHLISGRFRFDPASVRTETLQGARVIHVDAYPEEEAAAVAASGGVTIDGFFVPPYGCDGGSITGALASADASTEFTAAHQFRNPYKDELGRFTTPEGDADGVEDIEIEHDPDFPVKEGFKRVFTHSARLRAAKERGVSIPPGWRNTQVSKDPDAPGLRARGVDAAGRVQPRYSRDHIESASAEKYQRILSFQTRYAERLDDHLREDAETDPTAGAVVLMRRMGLRPGSTADTRAKVQAYGATTLEARHVKFLPDGETVKLDFTGKKGVRIQLSTKDKLVYRTLLAHTAGKKPGERIFQTTSDRTNAYLTRVLPDDAPKFTNRDLRTILGTGYARRMTRRMPIPRTAAENRRARKKVAERVARILGNEPGEALRSYIAPEVFDAAGW